MLHILDLSCISIKKTLSEKEDNKCEEWGEHGNACKG